MKNYKITEQSLQSLRSKGVPREVLEKLESIKNQTIKGKSKFLNLLSAAIGHDHNDRYKLLILKQANIFKRSYNYFVKKALLIRKKLHLKILGMRSRDGFLLKDIQGSKMYLDLRDKGISRDLIFSDIREEKSTRYMYRVIKKNDIVVDIGANIGYYALLEAKLVGSHGKVYAIEPVQSNMELLRRNIAVNGYTNMELFNFAIGDRNQIGKLYISSKSNWHSLIPFETQNSVSSMDVRVYTMDSFLQDKEYPSLMRMDVEGYEGKIIQGMHETLGHDKPLKLFIELHPHRMERGDVVELLNTLEHYEFKITMVADRKKSYDFSIDSMLNDESVLNGSMGGFEIFFERT